MSRTNYLMLALGLGAVLGGCASDASRRYRGHPVAAAVTDFGPPSNMSDLSNGRRLFQWSLSDVRIDDGIADEEGERWWTSERGPLGGGFRIGPCARSVEARFDEGRGTWVTTRYKVKYPESCSMRGPLLRIRPISYLQ